MTSHQPRRRRLQGREEGIAALDDLILGAARTLHIFERDLEWGGYDSLARFEALNAFFRRGPDSRVRLVVHDTAFLVRHCPRLMDLYQRYAHVFEIRQTLDEARRVSDPFAVADGRHYVRRFHYDQGGGEAVFDDPVYAALLLRRHEEIWHVSEASVVVTPLGL
jgi:hypothetical protein